MTRDLTSSELRLLVLLAHGRTISKAADAIGIKPQSAKNKLNFIYAKLGAANRYEAFMEMGWLTPPEIEEG